MSREYCGAEFEGPHDPSGLYCERLKGHSGDHRATWAKTGRELCAESGEHVWTEWKPWPGGFYESPRDWKVVPTAIRRCERCYERDYEGGVPDTTLSDLLMEHMTRSVEAQLKALEIAW